MGEMCIHSVTDILDWKVLKDCIIKLGVQMEHPSKRAITTKG